MRLLLSCELLQSNSLLLSHQLGALDQLEPAPRQHLTNMRQSGSWVRSEEAALRFARKHGVFLEVCCAKQRLRQ